MRPELVWLLKFQLFVFVLWMYSLLFQGISCLNLFVLLQLVLVPFGGRKTSPRTSLRCSLYLLLLFDHWAYSGILKINMRVTDEA